MIAARRFAPARGVAATLAALVTLTALSALASCGEPSAGKDAAPNEHTPSVMTAETLLAAPAQLVAGDAALSIEVEAWRSFQPLVDSASTRLVAVIRVSAAAADSTAAGTRGVPGALGIDAVWLVHGTEVVRGEAREEQPREAGASTVEFVLRDGPTWPAGDSIDVVVSASGVSNAPRLLRAPRIAIARVD